MSALDRLLGSWEFTMRHAAVPGPVTGRQRYERVLDDAFVLQHWTYDHPGFRLDDDSSQRYTARFRGPDVAEGAGEASRDRGVTWRPDFTMTSRRRRGHDGDPARGPGGRRGTE